MMRHPTAALLVALTLTLIWALTVRSSAEIAQWTPSTAKELVSLGWDEIAAVGTHPTVVYSLQFVQLSTQASRNFGFDIVAASETYPDSGWGIQLGEDVLRFVGGHVEDRSSVIRESWLVTVGNEPIRLAVREESIASDGRTTEELSIVLKPERIDSEGQRIFTHLVFDSTSHGGAQAKTTTSLWIGQAQPQLIAVVTHRIQGAGGHNYRHFALYIQGTVVAAEQVPAERRIVPVGNVRAFQSLLPQPITERELPHFGFAFTLDTQDKGSRFETELFQLTHQNHRLHIKVGGKAADPLWYSVRVDLNLAAELSWVTKFDQEGPGMLRPAIRWGVSEHTKLTPTLEASATLLPLLYVHGNGFTTEGSSVEATLRYELKFGDVFAEVNYAGQLQSTLGLGIYPTREQGLEFRWIHTPGEPHRLSLRAVTLRW